MKNCGFTLVELSIVLVIIGLLIGGILVGQSLIESAKVNRVVSEFKQYEILANQFKSRFRHIPGDMPNAQQLFGTTACPNVGTNLCNGNGDSFFALDNPYHGESNRFWQHLYLAGFLKDVYDGGPAVGYCYVNQNDCPKSSYSDDAHYGPTWSRPTGTSYYVMDPNKNYLLLGRPQDGQDFLNYRSSQPASILKPAFAAAIDRKLDDGNPGEGLVRGGNYHTTNTSDSAPYAPQNRYCYYDSGTNALTSDDRYYVEYDGDDIYGCKLAYELSIY